MSVRQVKSINIIKQIDGTSDNNVTLQPLDIQHVILSGLDTQTNLRLHVKLSESSKH